MQHDPCRGKEFEYIYHHREDPAPWVPKGRGTYRRTATARTVWTQPPWFRCSRRRRSAGTVRRYGALHSASGAYTARDKSSVHVHDPNRASTYSVRATEHKCTAALRGDKPVTNKPKPCPRKQHASALIDRRWVAHCWPSVVGRSAIATNQPTPRPRQGRVGARRKCCHEK